MMRTVVSLAAVFAMVGLLASCSPQTSGTTGTGTAPGPTGGSTTGSLVDPKSSISYQLDLLKAGDADKLKTCLTSRVRDEVTPEVVAKAKGEAANMTMDDLFASSEMGETDGKKTAKVKMKNGRTLTTLIEEDGKWLADTIWFK